MEKERLKFKALDSEAASSGKEERSKRTYCAYSEAEAFHQVCWRSVPWAKLL